MIIIERYFDLMTQQSILHLVVNWEAFTINSNIILLLQDLQCRRLSWGEPMTVPVLMNLKSSALHSTVKWEFSWTNVTLNARTCISFCVSLTCLFVGVCISLNSTGPTRTPTPTPACPARAEVGALARRARPVLLADLSADFCPTLAFLREDVRWGCARVHVYVYCTW